MGTYVIRPASEADHDAVVACVQAAYHKYIARIGRKPRPLLSDYRALIAQNVTYILVNEQDAICGLIVMYPEENSMLIDNIAIDPRYQGQGLGSQLMAFAEQQARAAQLPSLYLFTNELMTENLGIYHHLGFVEEERRDVGGYHLVFLRKLLA
jgi:N-acetylglutamate synthase-like GNAT family acetyltransferase